MTAIRQMIITDLPEVFSVRVATKENAVSMLELKEDYGLTPDSLAIAMQESTSGWVCESDGRIVGFAMGDSNTAELTVLAVLPEYERRGIGNQLLTTVQDWLFALGHDELWLVTTPEPSLRAYGFYVSQGWRATGELVDEEDEKFVLRRS